MTQLSRSNKFDEFIQIYIGNAKGDAAETTSLKMPNTYGIWQEGQAEKNYFAGEIFMLPNLPVYADNATTTAGHPIGALYRTSTGDLKVRY